MNDPIKPHPVATEKRLHSNSSAFSQLNSEPIDKRQSVMLRLNTQKKKIFSRARRETRKVVRTRTEPRRESAEVITPVRIIDFGSS